MCTCANIVAPEASQSCPAQQVRNEHPPENGFELFHWKEQLMVGLCAKPVRPCKPPQIGAKLGTPRGSTTRRNVKGTPKQTCLGLAWPCEQQGDQHCKYGHLKTETARPNLQIASEFQQPSCSTQDCQEHHEWCHSKYLDAQLLRLR